MIRFWYLESSISGTGAWFSVPWFQATECYRSLELAEHMRDWLLGDAQEDSARDQGRALERWHEIWGKAAPPMPEAPLLCRIVTAKGSLRLLGSLPYGERFRRRSDAPNDRAVWTSKRRTYYVVVSSPGAGKRILGHASWSQRTDMFLAFRTQREAIQHGRERQDSPTLHRIDADLEVVEG